MRGACIMLAVVILALSRLSTAVEGDAERLTCYPDDAFGVLTSRNLVQDVCPGSKKGNSCCTALNVPWPQCASWNECPEASLTDPGSISFINTARKNESVSDFLHSQCPCRRLHQATTSSSKLLLILHPLYTYPDSTGDLGVSGIRLPDIYAGAYAHIAMNQPQAQGTNCCCCLRLDYYLTWSQMRAYGNKNGSSYLADWINDRFHFINHFGRGRWSNTDCPFTKVDESSTIASGNAIFQNGYFDVMQAIKKVANAGFLMRDVTIQFTVTVVVALSEYCYKIHGTTSDCHYHDSDLKGCVYRKPQVVRTLAAGQASYSQMIHVADGKPDWFGTGTPDYRVINQEDDIKCLEKIAGNGAIQFREEYGFNLNISNAVTNESQSSSWEALKPNYFTHAKCKHSGM